MDKLIILGGDFNTYLNPPLDKVEGTKEETSETAKFLLNICDEFSIIDIYTGHRTHRVEDIYGIIKGDQV